MAYFSESITQVCQRFHTHKTKGLTKGQVSEQIRKVGKNVLPSASHHASALTIFVRQWLSPLILILVGAGVVSGLLHEFIDMTIILITAAINAFIGFFQEYKANRALEALQQYVTYDAIVIRDGKEQQIPATELVPGDLLLIKAGDKIQADGRLIRVQELAANEAPLTGESVPVLKCTRSLSAETPLGDRKNMLFRGTTVTAGEGMMIVTATGKETEIGKIAALVKETTEDPTPLQQQLDRLGNYLALIVLGIAFGIFTIGILGRSGDYGVFELFETAVAVAVAAIPEGLVISLTVILAIGMQHILKRKALIRKLLAAETLGSVSVICTDKTGTITEGNMRVTHVMVGRKLTRVEDILNGEDADQQRFVLKLGVLVNDATVVQDTAGELHVVGDTTEVALVHAAQQLGISKEQLEKKNKRLSTIGFTSDRKYMATLHRTDAGNELYVKGAPEIILERCTKQDTGGESKSMSVQQRKEWLRRAEVLAAKGYRTLAIAYTPHVKGTSIHEADVKGLTFAGLLTITDPVRPEVKDTIRLAQKAGIRVIMITGDHHKTAQAVAQEVGLQVKAHQVCDGTDLHEMSEVELEKRIDDLHVFARVNPADKIRLVRALQAQGHVVAMTGDGVNDAPALKGADIGVAVGSGTAVAKETADMVLLEDSFSTIVSAVEEGRRIYQNVKKIVLYLLAGSISEVALIGGSLIAGLPLAVLPAQILWVNIIEDSFPNMALAFDRGDRENMEDPPRKRGEKLIDLEMKTMIAVISIVSNLVLFSLFLYYLHSTSDINLTRTIMFVGLGVYSLFYIYSVRSMRRPVWKGAIFDNKYLTASIVFGWVMLLSAVYLPPLQYLLRTVPLELSHWLVLIGFGCVNLFFIELTKGIFLRRNIIT